LDDEKGYLWIVDAFPSAQAVRGESVVSTVGNVASYGSDGLTAHPLHMLDFILVGNFELATKPNCLLYVESLNFPNVLSFIPVFSRRFLAD
jgi:hypothetical protein